MVGGPRQTSGACAPSVIVPPQPAALPGRPNAPGTAYAFRRYASCQLSNQSSSNAPQRQPLLEGQILSAAATRSVTPPANTAQKKEALLSIRDPPVSFRQSGDGEHRRRFPGEQDYVLDQAGGN